MSRSDETGIKDRLVSRSDETDIKTRLLSRSDEKYIYFAPYIIYGETSVKTRETITIKYTWHLTSTETIRLIRDGEMEGVWRWGEEGDYNYTYRYTVTTGMGSNESHFNV